MTDEELLALMYDFYNEHVLRDQNDDIEYYLKQIEEYQSKKLLVVGAGTGRVAIPISKNIELSALDLDPARLKVLKNKEPNINTICCDIVDYKKDRNFDMIILPYSTLQFGGSGEKTNNMISSLTSLMDHNTVLIFDVSESFNNKDRSSRKLLFSDYCREVDDNIDVYYSAERYESYMEFLVDYYLEKQQKHLFENEKYSYYEPDLLTRLLDENGLYVSKKDDGYGNPKMLHKHLYHCRRL